MLNDLFTDHRVVVGILDLRGIRQGALPGEEFTEQRECNARTLRQKPLGEVKESKASVAAAV